VRNNDGDGAVGAQPENGPGQRLIAFGIKIRVGLVQYDQERIAVECAGERDALRLPGRERAAVIADHGVVALGQVDDEVVDAGRLGRRDNGIRVRRILETADVLRHRTVEQFDVLGDVADMPAERFGRPLVERRAIEPHRAAHRPPDSDQHAR
jgi:hypothetical protein